MGSLLADPGYIRNAGSVELPFAGSAGLPLAEHQPPWLLKKDVLVEDGRDKDCANHTVERDQTKKGITDMCMDAASGWRRHSRRAASIHGSWLLGLGFDRPVEGLF